MIRSVVSLTLVALPLLALAGPAEQIAAKYAVVDKCILKKDGAGLSKAFDSFCTKNFMMHTPTENATLAQTKAGFLKEFKMMKKVISSKSDLSKLDIKGSETTIKAVHKISYIGTDGHKYAAAINATDTWVKLNNDWKFISETNTSYFITKDGKPMNMSAVPKPARVSQ